MACKQVKNPEVGDIAISHGQLGVVCDVHEVNKPDGTSQTVWFGVQISPDPGRRWQSKAPIKVLTPSDYLENEAFKGYDQTVIW